MNDKKVINSLDNLKKLREAKYFNCSVDYLLRLTNEVKPYPRAK